MQRKVNEDGFSGPFKTHQPVGNRWEPVYDGKPFVFFIL